MSGLFSSLSGVSTALAAFSRALGAEQANVSNSSTPGYAAQRAVIHPIGFGFSSGAGFDTVSVQSTGIQLADALVRASASQAGASEAESAQLSLLDQQFDISGNTGIPAALNGFSSAFADLSVTPNDAAVGANAIAAVESVAAAFRTAAQNVAGIRNRVAVNIDEVVTEMNDLAGKIAQLNAQIRNSRGQNDGSESGSDAGLDASRRTALEQLASDVGLTVIGDTDGTLNVLVGASTPLVLGDRAYAFSASDADSSFSGTLGGLLETKGTIHSVLEDLNTLVSRFATAANAVAPLFTFDAANPASSIQADAPVATAAWSNGVANALAGLAGQPDSAHDRYALLAQSVGRNAADATNRAAQDQTSLTAARSAQTEIEGVSLDVEAVNITAYQRAWQASAKLIGVLDNLALDAVNLVGQQDT
jgi:flagellar hook-associated protein 1 FlgK